MRERLSRWWARKKVKTAWLLGGRADNKCRTSQTDSSVRQLGSKLKKKWCLSILPALVSLFLATWGAGLFNLNYAQIRRSHRRWSCGGSGSRVNSVI